MTSYLDSLPLAADSAPPQAPAAPAPTPAAIATPSGSTGFTGKTPPASEQATLPSWAGGTTNQPAISAPPTDKVPSGSYLHTLPQAADQGVQDNTANAQAPGWSWSNIGGALPSGVYEGITKAVNLPTHIANAAQNVAHGVGMDVPQGTWQPPIAENPTNYQPVGPWATGIHDASSAAANTLALSGAGKLAELVAPAGSATQTVARTIGDVTPGQVTAAAVGGAAEKPISQYVPPEYQPFVNMVANVGAGTLINAAETGAKNLVRGNVSPETAALANQAQAHDIDLRPGQISGSRFVKQADSAVQSIPFSGMRDAADTQQGQFNRAVSQTFGEDADKITPMVLAQARTRIGGVMEDVENRNSVTLDQTTLGHLAQIETNAQASLTAPEYQVVQRQLDNIIRNVQPGNSSISGMTYGNLIHKGSPLDAIINSKNANLSSVGDDIRGALQDSLQRSLNGPDLQAYQLARTQWKAMKTVEPLTGRADVVGGPSVAEGDIIPSQLRGAVNRSYTNFATAGPGDIPLNDLAKIGQRFLKEYPSSGTAERGNIFKWLGGEAVGGGIGGLIVEHGLQLPSITTALGAGGAVVGTGLAARAAGSALKSKTLAEYMASQRNDPSLLQRSVSLVASAANRNLGNVPASTNPQTGAPEYSLEANQQLAAAHPAMIAQRLLDGSLPDHTAVQGYIDQNKQALRAQHGGQGIQRVNQVAALLRRAQSEPGAPSTAFSHLANGEPSQAVQDAAHAAGVHSPEDLLALAIVSPDLTRELSARGYGPIGERRLISALAQRGNH
jgi:hypothetical protein